MLTPGLTWTGRSIQFDDGWKSRVPVSPAEARFLGNQGVLDGPASDPMASLMKALGYSGSALGESGSSGHIAAASQFLALASPQVPRKTLRRKTLGSGMNLADFL